MISISNIILVIIILILVILLNQTKENNTKEEFLINLAVLDHVIDDYIQIVYNSKVEVLRKLHNLDPASPLNSIKSFETKMNTLLSETTMDIIKLLTKQTSNQLRKRFSDKSLALYISNKIRNIT